MNTTGKDVLRISTARGMLHAIDAGNGLTAVNMGHPLIDWAEIPLAQPLDTLALPIDGAPTATGMGNPHCTFFVDDVDGVDLATFGRELGIEVRFIEFMPLDATGHWVTDSVVGQDEIVAAISEVYPLQQLPSRGAAPADRWRYLDGRGTVGVIPTVTKPFCGDCDRVRLTAEGQFRTCLFATDEFDLMAAMRAGEDDDQLARRVEAAIGTKWAGHRINQVNFIRPGRSMSQIGG
jgi:cyclic pyranopterin phosphate synthase